MIYVAWLYFIGKLFLKKQTYVISVSFLFGYAGFMAIALLTNSFFWELFDSMNKVNTQVVFVFFIKLVIVIPILLFLIQTIFKNQYLIRLQNSNCFSLNAVFLLIFAIHDFGYYHSLGLNSSLFYTFLFYITALVYVTSIALIYVYYKQYVKEATIKTSLVTYSEEIDAINNQFQMKIMHVLKSYSDSSDMLAMKDYTQHYLDKNFIFAQRQRLKGIKDEQVILLINERIKKYSNVSFEITNRNFTLEHISSVEKYFLEMFGIILDNAVESAVKSEGKRVEIIFSESNVIVKNTFTMDDLIHFTEKTSNKGNAKRVNGLKLLEYLNSKSDIILLSDVSDMVCMKMMVIS